MTLTSKLCSIHYLSLFLTKTLIMYYQIYKSQYGIEFILSFLQVFTQWKEIALTIRNKEFTKDEEHAIDIFDLKVYY